MTTDEAKRELQEVSKIDRNIRNLKETIARLRANLTNTAVHLSPDKVQTSHNNNQMADTMAEIIQLENDLNARIEELTGNMRKILKNIWQIPDLDEQTVLIARYMNEKDWSDIAEDFGCTTRQVHNYHARGLQDYCERK